MLLLNGSTLLLLLCGWLCSSKRCCTASPTTTAWVSSLDAATTFVSRIYQPPSGLSDCRQRHPSTANRRRPRTTTRSAVRLWLGAANNNDDNNKWGVLPGDWSSWTTSIRELGSNVLNLQQQSSGAELQQRKEALLQECRLQSSPPVEHRTAVEARIQELIESVQASSSSASSRSFVTATTAASPRLQKKWKLVYTTEKEINFFLNAGLAREIYQTIQMSTTPQLRNEIPFVKGGSFCVEGRLAIPDDRGVRTEFEFTTAILNLGAWGEYRLPPVGKGWFDTIYLDDALRIDCNSRQDILICVAE